MSKAAGGVTCEWMNKNESSMLKCKQTFFSSPFFTQSELMSAVLDSPLNGLGVIPLASTVPGHNNSRTCMDALNTLINACRGMICVDMHTSTRWWCLYTRMIFSKSKSAKLSLVPKWFQLWATFCPSSPGDMDGCAVILVCGPKNVGKSTFIRTLINSLLNQ